MICRLMSRIVLGRATLAFLRSMRRILLDGAKRDTAVFAAGDFLNEIEYRLMSGTSKCSNRKTLSSTGVAHSQYFLCYESITEVYSRRRSNKKRRRSPSGDFRRATG